MTGQRHPHVGEQNFDSYTNFDEDPFYWSSNSTWAEWSYESNHFNGYTSYETWPTNTASNYEGVTVSIPEGQLDTGLGSSISFYATGSAYGTYYDSPRHIAVGLPYLDVDAVTKETRKIFYMNDEGKYTDKDGALLKEGENPIPVIDPEA